MSLVMLLLIKQWIIISFARIIYYTTIKKYFEHNDKRF